MFHFLTQSQYYSLFKNPQLKLNRICIFILIKYKIISKINIVKPNLMFDATF